jgi:hypothetical protein
MPTSKALSLTLARRFKQAEHSIHILLVLLALALAFPAIFTTLTIAIDVHRLHLDWKTIVGIVVIIIQVILHIASRRALRRAASTPIGPLHDTSLTVTGFQIEPVSTRASLEELAEYLNAHYPADFISHLRLNSRREMYARWQDMSPNFAQVVRRTTGTQHTIAGCCVLLPITIATFAGYRNGLGAPDAWEPANVHLSPELHIFFMPALHFQKGESTQAPDVLAELFASFAGTRITDTKKTLIVAPIRTESEQANAKALGFEMFRHSKAGFEIWELDGRRMEELSASGRNTFTVLAARHSVRK